MSYLRVADFVTLVIGLVICACTAAIILLYIFFGPFSSSMSAPTPSEVVASRTMDHRTADPSCLSTTP